MASVRVTGVRVTGVRVTRVRVTGIRVTGVRVTGVRVTGVNRSGGPRLRSALVPIPLGVPSAVGSGCWPRPLERRPRLLVP